MSDRPTRLELTTVTPDSATFHETSADGVVVDLLHDLAPATAYEHRGIAFTTLPRPAGELRSRFATVNDVHFGETAAGRLGDSELGPILRAMPGEPPYPETMNRAAVAEMVGAGPLDAVFVKGDLSDDGEPDEFAAFEACYRPAFGDRLHVVRGNHDGYRGQRDYAGDRWVDLPGVAVALLDTVRAGLAGGDLSAEQLDWLDAHAAASTAPVLVMAHHPQWFPNELAPPSFLLDPDASRALDDLFVRRPSIVAFTAGHTHRQLVTVAGGGVPSIEIGCVKDFPGVWVEYQAYDAAILQIVHRISSLDALAWSERCRALYSDFGVDYTEYALGRLDHRCFVIALRA